MAVSNSRLVPMVTMLFRANQNAEFIGADIKAGDLSSNWPPSL